LAGEGGHRPPDGLQAVSASRMIKGVLRMGASFLSGKATTDQFLSDIVDEGAEAKITATDSNRLSRNSPQSICD
jgi:hypothetical protein